MGDMLCFAFTGGAERTRRFHRPRIANRPCNVRVSPPSAPMIALAGISRFAGQECDDADYFGGLSEAADPHRLRDAEWRLSNFTTPSPRRLQGPLR